MGIFDAILLGIIEGLTELLPVSSTGHLILAGDLLEHRGEAVKTLEVVIQLGAVLAIALYFRERLLAEGRGLLKREERSIRLWLALGAAFVPTAVAGLLLHRWVKDNLFGPKPVAAALAVGGVLMIAVDRWYGRREQREGLEHIGVRQGLWIGLCQCLALWPGASRSMTTIVGGKLCGVDTRTAAEFSFLLALPTLGAATLFDFYKNGALILAMPGGLQVLAVGTLVSFAVTWLVVALFLRYVSRVGLVPFAIYRLALAAAVLLFS